MMTKDKVEIVPYDPEWPGLFIGLGTKLREALGAVAIRIDHIGSTAVRRLAAKPIIDIQIDEGSLIGKAQMIEWHALDGQMTGR